MKYIEKRVRVNQGIRAREVRVIGSGGEQLGIMPTAEAIRMAEEKGLDLVEVAPTAVPPVCRIMDYGKFKYEQSKKQHIMKQHQKVSHVKEVKIRPYTDTHDLEFKMRHVRRFLQDGNKAKVTMMFRGRELSHVDLGKSVLEGFAKGVEDIGVVEHPPRMEGHNMIMVIAPK